MDNSTLIQLYKTMLLIRKTEESFVNPINSKEINCPVHLYSGQEAIAVGILSQLTKQDTIFGNHRSHGHYLAKGGNLNRLVAEVYCRETGCSRGRGGSMHLYQTDIGFLGSAPIVAGTISLAMGAALAAKIRQSTDLAVSFFGDGASNEGAIYECLNFASLQKLPLIFVCENNLYATHMPIGACRPNANISRVAEPFDIPVQQVDGNDLLAVHETAAMAIKHCRAGNGPYFLECLTYRLHGHVGPDDQIQGMHTDIRPKEEFAAWVKRDPIIRLRQRLLAESILTPEQDEKLHDEVIEQVAQAHRFAQASDFPIEEDLANYVFATS